MSICEDVRAKFALLLYGELGFDEEERVESHLDGCAECRTALIRQKAIHAAFDQIEIAPPPSLLRECREDLSARLEDERALPRPMAPGWWDKFLDALTLRPSAGMLRPVGALALVALGFAAARMIPAGTDVTGFISAGLGDSIPGHVRYVEREPDGRVQMVVDETRQRIISGNVDQQPIRALLLAAAKDPNDPGLRAETLEILNARAQAADIRDALIFALQHDPNDGVRMKAIDGLKPFANDPQVRTALRYVLLSDTNRGMRTQAIDLLVKGDNFTADREMIGTLQEVMERGEQLTYVRERCRRVLEAVNASAETY